MLLYPFQDKSGSGKRKGTENDRIIDPAKKDWECMREAIEKYMAGVWNKSRPINRFLLSPLKLDLHFMVVRTYWYKVYKKGTYLSLM